MTWEAKREQSYNYLKEYKQELTQEAYERIFKTIGSQAIENFFTTKESIKRLIRLEKNESSADELIGEYLSSVK